MKWTILNRYWYTHIAIPQWLRWFSKWNHFYYIRLDFPDPKPNRRPISAQLLWYVSHIHFVYTYQHENASICQVSACPMVHSICRKCILRDQWHWHMFKTDWKQYLSHFLWTHVHIAFRRLYSPHSVCIGISVWYNFIWMRIDFIWPILDVYRNKAVANNWFISIHLTEISILMDENLSAMEKG